MKSIRVYLVVAVLSAMTLTVFISALQGYRTSMVKAEELFDKKLDGVASLLLSVYNKETLIKNTSVFADSGMSADSVDSPEILYQVWRGDEEKLLIDGVGANPLTTFEDGYSYQNYLGYRWRMLTRFHSPQNLWIMVGERTDVRFLLAENVVVESIWPILIGLPVAAFFIWWLIGSGLAVLNRLTFDLTRKQVDDLTEIHYERTPRELTSVIDSINLLFNRLDQSFQRERNFASDAAHELRTPISALKVHVHNLKYQYPQSSEIITAIDSDLLRLEHLVEQILLLYRTTPENYHAEQTLVDLAALATEEVAEIYPAVERKRQSIELQTEQSFSIQGDNNFIKILISNLLLNANKYTPDYGKIIVALEEKKDLIWLTVKNSGPGIAVEEFDRVFDRFYRVGGDRHASKEAGCGLGLSIVKHIADLHRAEIVLSRTDDDLFCIAVGFAKNMSSSPAVENS